MNNTGSFLSSCHQRVLCSVLTRRPAWFVVLNLMYVAAWIWRLLLFRTTWIAVTGSLGKTTAKQCLAAILATRYSTACTFANQNDYYGVPRTILRVRPRHRMAVVEIGVGSSAMMKRLARLVRPDIAVILNVKGTHTTEFRDLDDHAAAKALLLRRLRTHGLAVLNGDDPRVAAMTDESRFSVRTFGSSPSFDLWSDRVSSRWPSRLHFRVHWRGEVHPVETRLVGVHWLHTALAALAVATGCRVPLVQACAALKSVEPFPGRLCPMRLPVGAVVLRDDYCAPFDGLEPALRVMEDASAARRVMAITDFSDFGKNRRRRLKYLGRRTINAFDFIIFIGEKAAYGRRRAIDAGINPEHVHAVRWPEQGVEILRRELKSGDLVLLKGRTTDHAVRIFYAMLGDIACWKRRCTKRSLCDGCAELGADPEDVRKAELVK